MRVIRQAFVQPTQGYKEAYYSAAILRSFPGEVLHATVLAGYNMLNCSILLHLGPPISFVAVDLKELLEKIGERVRVECKYEEAECPDG